MSLLTLYEMPQAVTIYVALTEAKLLVLKMYRKRRLAHEKSDMAVHIAEPAPYISFALLDLGGSFSEGANGE